MCSFWAFIVSGPSWYIELKGICLYIHVFTQNPCLFLCLSICMYIKSHNTFNSSQYLKFHSSFPLPYLLLLCPKVSNLTLVMHNIITHLLESSMTCSSFRIADTFPYREQNYLLEDVCMQFFSPSAL